MPASTREIEVNTKEKTAAMQQFAPRNAAIRTALGMASQRRLPGGGQSLKYPHVNLKKTDAFNSVLPSHVLILLEGAHRALPSRHTF